MSHFLLLVVAPNSVAPELVQHLTFALQPFDEKLEVPEYEVECGCEQNRTFDKAWRDAKEACGPQAAQKQVRARFHEIRPSTPSQGPDPECQSCRGTGRRLTTYNPQAKWDWWQLGGRWHGALDGYNTQPLADYLQAAEPFRPFALLMPDGRWIERGEMGWWGCVSNEKDREAWWQEALGELRQLDPAAHFLAAVDCHI